MNAKELIKLLKTVRRNEMTAEEAAELIIPHIESKNEEANKILDSKDKVVKSLEAKLRVVSSEKAKLQNRISRIQKITIE